MSNENQELCDETLASVHGGALARNGGAKREPTSILRFETQPADELRGHKVRRADQPVAL